mmetsp:Transcript_2100/g.6057  ORF Transcript_2100/g.6057 Transcript_2100/m.6057 type:complete len:134 (-) Transcript_2100:154-555(-)|eukprot:CAMPEP_0181031754 /NCGR_PEP_ID=MMETSP1070-20121207/6395_1 /TAXON_ID=265543 /ORGANISM="Minutocellus polymorphus, Strain NH13" /LENGTH=133 /DNA_ID=CAMNT_0023109141 /DNA_START=154 /DNA_END=555 /DNA_ORIENTATION=-
MASSASNRFSPIMKAAIAASEASSYKPAFQKDIGHHVGRKCTPSDEEDMMTTPAFIRTSERSYRPSILERPSQQEDINSVNSVNSINSIDNEYSTRTGLPSNARRAPSIADAFEEEDSPRFKLRPRFSMSSAS